MKLTYKLSKNEISKAVADYVATKLGKRTKLSVVFQIEELTDYADRSIGHDLSAAVEIDEEADQP